MTQTALASATEVQVYLETEPKLASWGDPTFINLGSQIVLEGVYSAPEIERRSGTPLELEVEEWLATSRTTLRSIDDYIDELPEGDQEA